MYHLKCCYSKRCNRPLTSTSNLSIIVVFALKFKVINKPCFALTELLHNRWEIIIWFFFSESNSLVWNLRVKERIETSVRITESVYIANAGREGLCWGNILVTEVGSLLTSRKPQIVLVFRTEFNQASENPITCRYKCLLSVDDERYSLAWFPLFRPSSVPPFYIWNPAIPYSGVPRNFVGGEGGVKQIHLRSEDRENGDLGAVVPWSGVLEAAVIWYEKFHCM